MKLKHMAVKFTEIPAQHATLYYAYGEQDGRMYESHALVTNMEILPLQTEQLNLYVTNKLEAGIRELTLAEQMKRAQEMQGVLQ